MRHSLATSLALALPLIFAGCGKDDTDPEPTDDTDLTDVGADADASEPDTDTGETDSGAPDTDVDTTPDTVEDTDATELPDDVPLHAESPWPKFRRDAAQTGYAPFSLTDDGRDLWVVQTGKGIFSSPIVGADDTVYVGSADRIFYAIDGATGDEVWRFEDPEEIIDSSALLDDQGHIYFGAGDGHVYALDAATGAPVWDAPFEADAPTGLAIINWFEGNVTIGLDGTLVAGNDNFYVYGIDRETGEQVWRFKMQDQTWSAAAVDVETGRYYVGNNNIVLPFLGTFFAIDLEGDEVWNAETAGSMVASPLLTDGLAIAGGYDGFIHAFDMETGDTAWSFAAQDHVYASTSLHPDGFVVTPTADGAVYALDPATGEQVWAFDWGAPIRSSAAIDGDGHIYMGTGDGHLLVLNGDGTLRWALRLIQVDRDDMNASPALGYNAIYLAGESGEIFGVPFDFCLRDAEADNANCSLGPDEQLPAEGTFLLHTTNFGTTLLEAPAEIAPNEALAYTLRVREDGDTPMRLIDTDALTVTVTPEVDIAIETSADRHFLTVRPVGRFVGDVDGALTIQLQGDILANPDRAGLRTDGGEVVGSFDQTFTYTLADAADAPYDLPVPEAEGDPTRAFEMLRLAAPLPTILPSYNQIGFDSLHYLIGMVEPGVAWVVEGVPTGANGETVVLPGSDGVFAFSVDAEGGFVTFANDVGATLEAMGATITFDLFRVSASLDDDGFSVGSATVMAQAWCEGIELYGSILDTLGLCNPTSGYLSAFGAVLLEPWDDRDDDTSDLGLADAPEGVGTVSFEVTDGAVVATLEGSTLTETTHNVAILLVDAATDAPVSLPYGPNRTFEVNDDDGTLTQVTLDLGDEPPTGDVRAYLMVGPYPAATAPLTL